MLMSNSHSNYICLEWGVSSGDSLGSCISDGLELKAQRADIKTKEGSLVVYLSVYSMDNIITIYSQAP